MATDLCKYVFNQSLIKKRLKMAKSSGFCQCFRITVIVLKLLGINLCFRCTFSKSNLYAGGLARF